MAVIGPQKEDASLAQGLEEVVLDDTDVPSMTHSRRAPPGYPPVHHHSRLTSSRSSMYENGPISPAASWTNVPINGRSEHDWPPASPGASIHSRPSTTASQSGKADSISTHAETHGAHLRKIDRVDGAQNVQYFNLAPGSRTSTKEPYDASIAYRASASVVSGEAWEDRNSPTTAIFRPESVYRNSAQQTPAGRPKEEVDEVKWSPGEMANPYNWSKATKWCYTLLAGLSMTNATFSSTAPAGGSLAIMTALQMSAQVEVLVTALFVAGFVLGPIFWAPISEMSGRRNVFLYSNGAYTILQIGCALAQNKTTLLVCRFLAGTFAACPLTNAGGIITDVWLPADRGMAMAVFSLGPFLGPCLGPLVGGAIIMKTTWRWIFWTLLLFSSVVQALFFFFVKETYGPHLLVLKAKKMRAKLGNPNLKAPLELQDKSFKAIVTVNLARPLIMLFSEPIVFLSTLYVSFVYGVLYMFFQSFPIIFGGIYHFDPVLTGVAFLPMGLGGLMAAATIPLWSRRYAAACRRAKGPVPEERLPQTFLAGPLLVIGFFWSAWSARSSVLWISPMLAGMPLGMTLVYVFQAFLTYLADCYRIYASSAIAANVIARSICGAAFPLFTRQMFDKLGVDWANSLLAFLALALTPIPFFFYKYGQRIREKSNFAFS